MAQVSYPGVYVQEVPSGVRTIVGVSTSVTAFVGAAKRGPLNKAVQLFSFGGYEKMFGGLCPDSEMSYAVRQFFMNGGSEAWVIRVAKDASAASVVLDSEIAPVLKLTAQAQGAAGNQIAVSVDHDTANPASTFNLRLESPRDENPTESVTEQFLNLSMNKSDPRFAETVINATSRLVAAERVHDGSGLGAGTSLSGDLSDAETLVDETHYRLRVVVNGTEPVPVDLVVSDIEGAASLDDKLDVICARIESEVSAQEGVNTSLSGFTCARDGSRILLTSGMTGEASSVRILPGVGNDAAGWLRLGVENGGIETDAAAALRPAVVPEQGRLTSGDLEDFDWAADGPGEGRQKLRLQLDNGTAIDVDVGDEPATDMAEMAGRIEAAVRDVQPGITAFEAFLCGPDETDTRLVLSSGTRGQGSSVRVQPVEGDELATALMLTEGASHEDPKDIRLTGGNERQFTPDEAYPILVGKRSAREGIYALENVDIFNLLCLPGITIPGVLSEADAYCKERRAFLLVDAPRSAVSPAEMSSTVRGTALPKSDHAAVYYPWVEVADPLSGGRPRASAPCGTIAGVISATDATRGVWRAPAGVDSALSGVTGVTYKLTDQENGTLNPLGVNCIRVFPGYAAVPWGARTLRGADQMASEYKYVSIRRTALYIEESLYRGLKWVCFSPNNEQLWASIRLNVGAFMHTLFRQGAFQGASPPSAYFVKCDAETTPQAEIDLGRVNIWVGFAPVKPAEFVILYIQQMAGQIRT